MSTPFDVVVVGAGIIGAACAWELSTAGLRVAIVDEAFPGAGATGAAMGHIVVMDDSEAQFALTHYSQRLWDELEAELPRNVEFDRCGTIWVASDEEEFAEVRRKAAHYEQRGVRTEILDSHALRDAEPNLMGGFRGGLLVSRDSVIYPPAGAAFFLDRAAQRGTAMHFGKAVTAFGQGRVGLADGTVLQAVRLVNAAGQRSPRLTPGIPVKPRKGHLVITDSYPGFLRHQLVELGYLKSAHSLTSDSVAFNLQPRKTGQVLIGSSRQYGAEDDRVETAIVSKMLKRAFDYVPALADLSCIRVWTGFRPAAPDKLPLIGPWPEDPTVYLATGHEGLGITTSLATAKLLRAQILQEAAAIPQETYLPSRSTAKESEAPEHG